VLQCEFSQNCTLHGSVATQFRWGDKEFIPDKCTDDFWSQRRKKSTNRNQRYRKNQSGTVFGVQYIMRLLLCRQTLTISGSC